MKKQQLKNIDLRKEIEIGDLLEKIAPEKLERAIFCLKYLVDSSIEEGRMLVEYSKRDDATLDMMVEWVKNRQVASLIEVAI